MKKSFRQSMAWLHTWFGLWLGFVLMTVFFFGTLSVFDREFDRWAMPDTRFEPQPMPSYDGVLTGIFPHVKADEHELAAAHRRVGKLPEQLQPIGWGAYITHRDPVLDVFVEYAVPNPDDPFDHVHGHVTIDPRNGAILPHDQLKIGSEFFFPMHYSLHIEWRQLGTWLVGVAALIMLVALASGVVIHRRLFRELFTFRPHKKTQRSVLDLHNLTGVVALPFHFMFALSGLTVFAFLYFPVGETVLAKPAHAYLMEEATRRGLPFLPAGEPAPTASVDAMMAEARRLWSERGQPGEVGFLWVTHPGDSNSFVSVFRAGSDRVALVGQGIHFSAVTGEVLHEEPPPSAIMGANEFLTGLHLQHFQHWPLRWLYVLGGLAGCICIATAFIFFVEKRKRNLKDANLIRSVETLAITAVTGMITATVALLVVNRLLPETLAYRGRWEEGLFWLTWLLTLVHAGWRNKSPARSHALSAAPSVATPPVPSPSPAWREQCWAIAILAVTAVVLNALGTGDHLIKTLLWAPYWPVAGVDLALLLSGMVAGRVAYRLRRWERAPRQPQRSAIEGPLIESGVIESSAIDSPDGEAVRG